MERKIVDAFMSDVSGVYSPGTRSWLVVGVPRKENLDIQYPRVVRCGVYVVSCSGWRYFVKPDGFSYFVVFFPGDTFSRSVSIRWGLWLVRALPVKSAKEAHAVARDFRVADRVEGVLVGK